MAVRRKLTEREKRRLVKEANERKKIRQIEAENREKLRSMSDENLVKCYLQEMEEYYPQLDRSRDIKDYDKEIKRRGGYTIGLRNLKFIQFAYDVSNNEELIKKVDVKFATRVQANLLKLKNSKLLIDAYYFFENLKEKKLPELKIDDNKYAKAIAESNDLDENVYWAENEGQDVNFEVLLNSNMAKYAYTVVTNKNANEDQINRGVDIIIAENDYKNASQIIVSAKNRLGKNNVKRLRKLVIKSNDYFANAYLIEMGDLTKKEIEEHKKVILAFKNKTDSIGLSRAIVENRKYFTKQEINFAVEEVINSKNIEACKYLLFIKDLDVKYKTLIKGMIAKAEEKAKIKAEKSANKTPKMRKKSAIAEEISQDI